MPKLKFLGRGSAFNQKEGNTSAYYKEGNSLFLIDCGENIFERILKLDLLKDIESVHVLITHLHSDHVGSLSSLIFYCYYAKNIVPDIYYPSKKLNKYLKITCDRNCYDYHIIEEECDSRILNVNIESIKIFESDHVDSMKSYSYLINFYDKIIYYSGDSKKVPTSIVWNAKTTYNIDEIYQDISMKQNDAHMVLRDFYNIFGSGKAFDKNNIYCMHIDSNECIEAIKKVGFNIVEVEKGDEK